MNQKCKNCISIFGLAASLVVYECPFPLKDCEIKEKGHHEHIHTELFAMPPIHYSSMVTASTNEIIGNPLIRKVTPDPDRDGWYIYRSTEL